VFSHQTCNKHLYFLDIQTALREELAAAFDFLSAENSRCLWDFCTPQLVEDIRSRDAVAIARKFVEFGAMVPAHSQTPTNPLQEPEANATTKALAWAIVVESALLNARFLDDMIATHGSKGGPPVPEDGVPLFLTHLAPETCQFFNDYVRARWPIYVFALDPFTEDQNDGDSFSLGREVQLALSLAFTSGKIGTRSFTRYVRRIEQDIDTIAINRTIVGFLHGDNTFGWCFYPRVQTPPIDGNLRAFFRDLLIGGRSPGYELYKSPLENGTRECVALVIMPSFVPYVDLEVTGNWFRLSNPKCKRLDLVDTIASAAPSSASTTAPTRPATRTATGPATWLSWSAAWISWRSGRRYSDNSYLFHTRTRAAASSCCGRV
jgi:hypothetical protein